MTKNELIEALQQIEGDPEVLLHIDCKGFPINKINQKELARPRDYGIKQYDANSWKVISESTQEYYEIEVVNTNFICLEY